MCCGLLEYFGTNYRMVGGAGLEILLVPLILQVTKLERISYKMLPDNHNDYTVINNQLYYTKCLKQ